MTTTRRGFIGGAIGVGVQWMLSRFVWWLTGRLPARILRRKLNALAHLLLGWLAFLPLLWLGGLLVLGGSSGVGSMPARRGMGGLTILFTLPVLPLLLWRPSGVWRWARRLWWLSGAAVGVAWLAHPAFLESRLLGVADEDIGMAFFMTAFWSLLAWFRASRRAHR